ncbi:MAG: hypothetical protein ACOYMG_12040 [Candidatus Methylumidiphilus sp.]
MAMTIVTPFIDRTNQRITSQTDRSLPSEVGRQPFADLWLATNQPLSRSDKVGFDILAGVAKLALPDKASFDAPSLSGLTVRA